MDLVRKNLFIYFLFQFSNFKWLLMISNEVLLLLSHVTPKILYKNFVAVWKITYSSFTSVSNNLYSSVVTQYCLRYLDYERTKHISSGYHNGEGESFMVWFGWIKYDLVFVQCYCKRIIFIAKLQKTLGTGWAETGLRRPHFVLVIFFST